MATKVLKRIETQVLSEGEIEVKIKGKIVNKKYVFTDEHSFFALKNPEAPVEVHVEYFKNNIIKLTKKEKEDIEEFELFKAYQSLSLHIQEIVKNSKNVKK